MSRAINAIKGMSDHAKVLLGISEDMASQAATVMGNDARNIAHGVRGDASDAFDSAYNKLQQNYGYRYDSVEDKLRAMSYARRHLENAKQPYDLAGQAAAMDKIPLGSRADATLGQRVETFFSAPDASGNYDKTRLALAAVGGVLGTAAVARVGMNAVYGDY